MSRILFYITYIITYKLLTFGGCGAVIRSLLGLDTNEDGGDDTVSLAAILPPNNDVIDSAAESLDPGINPPGGIGGGGGGSSSPIVVVVAVSP